MKIACVAPSPVPFTIGGMENLMWGLCDAINQYTKHQCELIKLPSREHNFWDLIDTYYAFYRLDVSHFDAVICSKYPAWMVQHPNCICYMAHCLRGLYDTYSKERPVDVTKGHPYVDPVLDYMEANYCPDNLDEFFSLVFAMRDRAIPHEYLQFPGPFIRLLVRYMDRWGLSRTKTSAYYSISETVKKRCDYFPAFQNVEVLYPPTTLKQCTCGDYNYVFTASRLDAPKRLDMLVRAMSHVKSNVELLIAGRGPQLENLQNLAKQDSRIRFLGYVNDDQLEEYYANSLVIPYFPYDEDFGLITLEAMLHKKPIITTDDAGGPTELVTDGDTGFVVPFDEEAIAEKIDYMVANPDEARRMGEQGFRRASEVTWDKLALAVTAGLEQPVQTNRHKILVSAPFPIYPPKTGGQTRIYHVYKNIADLCDVEVVSRAPIHRAGYRAMIADGVIETDILLNEAHRNEELQLKEALGGTSIADVFMTKNAKNIPEYKEAFEHAAKDSDLVVVSHPFQYEAIKDALVNVPFIYEAHNVEYNLKKDVLPNDEQGKELLQLVYDVEKSCCVNSCLIMACSEEDRAELCRLYEISPDKVILVPNGVDTDEVGYIDIPTRLRRKEENGLKDRKVGLFVGSWHGPNIEACKEVFRMAEACPNTVFLLMGSQCRYFEEHNDQYDIPKNVGLLGMVSQADKNRIYHTVDFALNPVTTGSGTNLKIFDYMAAGIPVITTSVGARGLKDTSSVIVCDVDEMSAEIRKFSLENEQERIAAARKTVVEMFDWRVAVKPLREYIEAYFGGTSE